MLAVATLSVLPSRALLSVAESLDPYVLSSYLVMVSALTTLIVRASRGGARAGSSDRSTSRLHFWELLGGWPASLLARKAVGYRESTLGYQAPYWSIVLAHQYIAIEVIRDWEWSRTACAAAKLWFNP